MSLPDVQPGEFDFRSGDCTIHGVNVPFAKVYKAQQTPKCWECMQLEKLRLALALALGEEP